MKAATTVTAGDDPPAQDEAASTIPAFPPSFSRKTGRSAGCGGREALPIPPRPAAHLRRARSSTTGPAAGRLWSVPLAEE